MNKLDLSVIYLIFDNLDFLSKIKFRNISQYMHLLQIHDFYNIEYKYLELLNDEILCNYPFIKYLNARQNHKITSVNYMYNLIALNASGFCCGLSDSGIKVNLTYLNASGNPKIINVNHMNKLIELDAYDINCGITDDGIKQLNLMKLDASHNIKITNVNHMYNMNELIAYGNCGIDNEGIKYLNLKKLNAHNNSKITIKHIGDFD
jgi:hypothetical protein